MSMKLVQDVMEAIQTSQVLKGVGEPKLKQALESVHRDLCTEFHLFRDTFDITLVEDQREYLLDTSITSVDDAVYFSEDGVYSPLQGINPEAEHNHSPGWQSGDSGTPAHFYVRNGYIGFDPTPDTATDTGFPIVTISATVYQALITTDITPTLQIPAAIPDGELYVHGVARKLLGRKIYDTANKEALRINAELLQLAKDQYEECLRELERVVSRVNRQYKPTSNTREEWFTPVV